MVVDVSEESESDVGLRKCLLTGVRIILGGKFGWSVVTVLSSTKGALLYSCGC